MKITAFNGSPKGRKSITHRMVSEFLKGAKDSSAKTDEIFLAEKKIDHCRGCFNCWVVTPGKCVIADDMDDLIQEFISSDIAVIATPLYVDNVSGITKNFLDRLIPILDSHTEIDDNNESHHSLRYHKSPKLVVISNSGFPEQSHFQVLRLLFKRIARNLHSDIAGEIYRGAGPVLFNNSKQYNDTVQRYMELLYTAGQETAKYGKITETTTELLEKPLVPAKEYIKDMNDSFDRAIQKRKA